MLLTLALLITAVIATPSASAAQFQAVASCSSLDAAGLAHARQIADSEHVYDCCDETVSDCVAEAQPCKVAIRIADEICRRVADGQTDAAIVQSLQLRARTMIPGGPPATISLDGWPSIGSADAPVTIVTYLCLRCPFCATIEPKIIRAVTDGPLAGKAKLQVKLFPLKSHPGSSAAALGVLAAHEQGRFYDYLSLAFAEFDSFSEDKLDDWAAQVGLDVDVWRRSFEDDTTRAALVDSKREGIVNGVDATPTLFINGRKYHARLEATQIIDLVEEEYDRVTGAER